MCGRRLQSVLPFAAALLLCCVMLYGQGSNRITWEPVYGAGGYIIEIKNSSGRVIVEKEVASTYYDVSKLPEGDYQYRITTLNKLKQKGGSTSWIDLAIERVIVPVIKKISHKQLAWSYDNPEVTLSGRHFTKECRFFLRSGSKRIELDTDFISETEVRFSLSPGEGDAGAYDMVVIDKGGFEGVFSSALEIVPPDIPVVESLSPDAMPCSKVGILTVRGSNFGSDTVLIIEDGQGRRLDVSVKNISDTELVVKISPSEKDMGGYRVYALKRGFFRSERGLAFKITEPEIKVAEGEGDKHEKDEKPYSPPGIYAAAGWIYSMPPGDWAGHLDPSFLGFSLYLGMPVSALGVKNSMPVIGSLGIEVVVDYSVTAVSEGSSSDSYSIGSISAGVYYPFHIGFFPENLYLVVNLDAGLAWSAIEMVEEGQKFEYSDIDMILAAGVSMRCELAGFIFADLSAGYSRIFYVSHPLDRIALSVRAGIKF